MVLLSLLAAVAMSSTPSPPGQAHAPGSHGNPDDLTEYIARLEDPARDAWQKPDEVVKALALEPGQTVCEIGPGPGYFTRRLARAVGPKGVVFAVEVEARLLDVLRERLTKAAISNVVPVLGAPSDPFVPKKSCDVILVVDTFHHFSDSTAYLARLAASLKAGGRIVNIDFHKRELPVGPPPDRKVSREAFLASAKAAGLKLVDEKSLLAYQYFIVLGL